VACHRFEGDGLDESGEDNHANASGVQYVTGRVGQAAQFDAASLVTIGPDDSFGLAALTLEMWLRPSSLPATGRFGLIDHPGRWSAWLRPDGVYCRSVGPASIPTGSWSHVACVADGTTIEGVRQRARDHERRQYPRSQSHHRDDSSRLGRPGGGDKYLGDMDEVRLFDHVRTPTQLCEAAGGSGC
jgi:hypothetical protein